jgi:hypothetical protein
MPSVAHFTVDARLARLLGETYRSSELAIKELVDNAWDADAKHVWIRLPDAVTTDPLIVQDDGVGMTVLQLGSDYLKIASDKRTRTGDRTRGFNRLVKGRKGIGKFAGLTIAARMEVSSTARGRTHSLILDRGQLSEEASDLLAVPLEVLDREANIDETGTTISLVGLDSRLNFPTPERLREVLIYEYGREDNFKIYVNNQLLSLIHIPGASTIAEAKLPDAGNVELHFTVAEGKRLPRSPGIIIKVNGKSVGRPSLFGLDEDEEIPAHLLRRIFGELELSGLEDLVTADWGGFIENSKAYQELKEYVVLQVKEKLKEVHKSEMDAQQSRLRRAINRRLEKLPEHRRQFARIALNRILNKYYGESDDRIAVIADVALDAMEHDTYWAIIEQVNSASRSDIAALADSLDQFGIADLAAVNSQARGRFKVLDQFDSLLSQDGTLEKDVHTALEKNLWLLGRRYALMSSNKTLFSIIEKYCGSRFSGDRASKRPDLLLAQDANNSYLIIELKRPSHTIDRSDVSQAEQYRDDLSSRFPAGAHISIMMLGGALNQGMNLNNFAPNVNINTYAGLISTARYDLEWIFGML